MTKADETFFEILRKYTKNKRIQNYWDYDIEQHIYPLGISEVFENLNDLALCMLVYEKILNIHLPSPALCFTPASTLDELHELVKNGKPWSTGWGFIPF